MMRRLGRLVGLCCLALTGAAWAQDSVGTATGRADPRGLIADISSNQIDITSSFRGTSLLLFGAIDWRRVQHDKWTRTAAPGETLSDSNNRRPFDVIMVVEGPRQSYVVRHKEQVGGVWVNRHAATVRDMPSFYALTATRAPEEILQRAELKRYPMGFAGLPFDWEEAPPPLQATSYRDAVLRDMVSARVFSERPGSLVVMDHTLFRAEVEFPANVPVGPYRVDIYLVWDGKVIAHQTAPLSIDKIGFERAVYTFAKEKPALYGLIAVAIAVAAGMFAGALTRRFTG